MEVQATKTARNQFLDQSEGARIADMNAPRFFVQMGFATLGVDTHAVLNRQLVRGEITPCVTIRQKINIHELPEAMIIPGSEELDRDGRKVYAYYFKPAWFEAERLLETEGASERPNGVVEIKSLAGRTQAFREVDFNAVFYPQGLENLPETHDELIEHLKIRLDLARAGGVDVPAEYRSLTVAVGEELLAAAELAKKLQLQRIDYTHSCMKMPPSEEQYKRGYDPVDEEMLLRTGIPRIHEADLKVATAINTLADKQTNGADNAALMAMVEMMKQQMEQQQALINSLLANKQAESPSPTKSASKKDAEAKG